LDTLPTANGRTIGQQLSTERLFAALDGRIVGARSKQWLIEIYSVRQESGAIWLQLALQGETSYSLLMRLAPDEGPKHAIRILSLWLGNRTDHTRILNVA
jgi:hypothetical protein